MNDILPFIAQAGNYTITLRSESVKSADSIATGILPIIPSLLWILLIFIVLIIFNKEISDTLKNLSWRVRTGAALKLFSLELGQSYVPQKIDSAKDETALHHRKDKDEERWLQRQQYYKPNRKILLVHRLAPSNKPNMLYDIQIYLAAHRGASLACVNEVEYYFGHNWSNMIFTSTDRANSFSITTSAYGPFMCTAKLVFSDGEPVIISRYIDFEMGQIGKQF